MQGGQRRGGFAVTHVCQARVGGTFCGVAVAQRTNFAVQGHLVRRSLGIHHHQVAGHAAPRPQTQRLGQGAQQPQALGRSCKYQNQRPVAGDAHAPQQALVVHRRQGDGP